MTRGKQIANYECQSLLEYYYTISDCILAFGKLSYISDLCSSDILRQVVQKLPLTFHGKWAEYCFNVKQTKEPTLVDFENCFQYRILALKEAYLPPQKGNKKGRRTEEFYIASATMINTKCILYDNEHSLFKCYKYKSLGLAERSLGLVLIV